MENRQENKENPGKNKKKSVVLSASGFDEESLLEEVLDYFIVNEPKLVQKLQMNKNDEKLKNLIMKKARERFMLAKVEHAYQDELCDQLSRMLWGYNVLDSLINDLDISDIKVYDYNHIRIKKDGVRMNTDVSFRSRKDYMRFVKLIAVKNEQNLSTINAITTFTDKHNNDSFILRFTILTEYITSEDVPCLHIRKIPKVKWEFDKLIEKNFCTPAQRDYLIDRVKNSGGIYFAGKGGTGKTIIMNRLIEEIPHNKSGAVYQENEELFSHTHPDFVFEHIVTSNGEGKISYDLEKLARAGLLFDLDYCIIGEIKGPEAAAFAMASYTGHKCMASGHGKSEVDAIYKLADYVKQATDYTLNECLKMLSGIETVVFLKDFHIAGISEINGWDYENNILKIKPLDLKKLEVKAGK